MKKLLKRIIFTLVTAVGVIAAAGILGVTAAAEDEIAETSPISITAADASPVVWTNGGKITINKVLISDYRNYQFNLSTTGSAPIKLRAVSSANTTILPAKNDSTIGTVNANGVFVSKAKTDTTAKLWAADKEGNYAVFENITLKVAPRTVIINDKCSTDNTALKITKTNLNLGDSATFYIVGKAQNYYTVSPDATYMVDIPTTSSDYIDADVEQVTLADGTTKQWVLHVTAKALKNDKKTSAKVTVYNRQSGAKVNFSIIINNPVTSVTALNTQFAPNAAGDGYLEYVAIDSSLTVKNTKSFVVDPTTSGKEESLTGSMTDNPKIFVMTSATGYTISAKGVFSVTSANKSKFISAKFNTKSKTDLTITAKKGTPDCTAAWVAVVYNTTSKTVNDVVTYPGIYVFKVISGADIWRTDVTGSVQKNGEAIGGLKVYLYQYNEDASDYTTKTSYYAVSAKTAVSASNIEVGDYTIKNVPVGKYKAVVEAVNNSSIKAVSDSAIDVVAPAQSSDGTYAESTTEYDLGTLSVRGLLSFKVLVKGTASGSESIVPLKKALVGVYASDFEDNKDDDGKYVPYAIAQADSRGYVQFKNIPYCAEYAVAAVLDGYTATAASSTTVTVSVTSDANAAAGMGYKRSNISGFVKDADSAAALSGAAVTVGTGTGADDFNTKGIVVTTTNTGAFATTEAPAIEYGDYCLRIALKDYATEYVPFTISADTVNAGFTELQNIVLTAVSYDVKGTVSAGTTGAEVEGITVYLLADGETYETAGVKTAVTSGTKGDYSFSDVPAGAYTLFIRTGNLYAEKSVSLTVGGRIQTETDVDITAAAITLAAHNGIINIKLPASFSATASISSATWGDAIKYTVKTVRTGNNKVITFSGLAPASDYTFSFTDIKNNTDVVTKNYEYQDLTLSCDTAISENTVELNPTFTAENIIVQFTVTDSSSAPISGATVAFADITGTTDANGIATITTTKRSNGVYALSITCDGYTAYDNTSALASLVAVNGQDYDYTGAFTLTATA